MVGGSSNGAREYRNVLHNEENDTDFATESRFFAKKYPNMQALGGGEVLRQGRALGEGEAKHDVAPSFQKRAPSF